jgi:hypothetical protein
MDADVAFASLASGGTGRVGAKCCLRVDEPAPFVLLLAKRNEKDELLTLILSKINASTF